MPNVYDEEWVCEEHPEKPFGHDGCRGAGMLSDESCERLALPVRDKVKIDIDKLIDKAAAAGYLGEAAG